MAKSIWNYIVYDFETGGLDYKKQAAAEIGLIVLNGESLDEKARYSTFIKPYANLEYNAQALKINGITQQQINSGKDSRLVVEELIEIFEKWTNGKGKWKQKPILVAQNGDNFDIDFMRFLFEFNEKNLYDYVERHTEDIMWLARNAWQSGASEEQKYNLAAISEKLGIKVADSHRAMADVEVTVEAFKHFVQSLRNNQTIQPEVDSANESGGFWRKKVNFKF